MAEVVRKTRWGWRKRELGEEQRMHLPRTACGCMLGWSSHTVSPDPQSPRLCL